MYCLINPRTPASGTRTVWQKLLGKLDNSAAETGHRPIPDTIHKNKVQMDAWFKYKDWSYKQIRGEKNNVIVRFMENGEIFDQMR